MNPVLHWLTSPEWTHVVSALLHSLWQGAIIAIALAVLMRRATNPITRYRCALVMLGVLVTASIVTWAVLNAPKATAPIASSIPVVESEFTTPPVVVLNSESTDKVVVSGKMSSPTAPVNWTAWLALVWIVGAFVMLLRASIKVAGAENLRRSCKPLNDERMITLVAEACRAVDLARKIRVAVTDKLTSPAVLGIIVPTLILPLSLFSALTPEQIRFVLLHELAHIRRGDYLANLFQLFAEALLFFNPAVWWISHQIRREREACCDALAIELSGAPADYARTLVRVAENILQPTTTAALAFGDDGREPSPLADRVQRLLIPGYRPALRLTWRAMLTSLFVGGALLVFSAVGTRNTVGAILTSSQSTNSPVLLGPGINPDVQSGLSGDDSNIQPPLIPILTEFVGYDLATAATFVPTAITGSDQTLAGTLPLPIFRVRQLTTSNNIWDGHTNALGELQSDNVAKIKDKVPVLGDVPLLGKLFNSESSAARQMWHHGEDSFSTRNWTRPTPMEIIPLGTTSESHKVDASGVKTVFTNGAVVKFDNQKLTADNVEINHTTGELIARGNARLETTNGSHSGEELIFNSKSNRISGGNYKVTLPQHTISSAAQVSAALPREVEFNSSPAFGMDSWALNGNEQLNNRGFYYRVGSIRTNTAQNNPPTTNASKAEPLFTRTFNIDLPPFYAAVRKAAELPTTATGTNLFRAISSFFTNAGVRLDPALGKSFFVSTSRGDMWVRATGTELDAIEALLRPMRGTPLLHRTYLLAPEYLAKAKDTLAPEISSILATNPAAGFGALLESFAHNDPRPKQVRYIGEEIFVRATESDLEQFESVLKGILSKKPSLETNSSQDSPPLITRTFQVEPGAIRQAIESLFPQFNPVTSTNFTASIRALLESSGAKLSPPKSVYYNDRAGGLFVRATREDLDAIESLLNVIGQQPAQVNIKALFVELPFGKGQPKELAKILEPITRENETNFTGILTASQFKTILRVLETSADVKILARPQVTTLSGRQAQIQVADVKTIISGMTAVVTNGATNLLYQSQAKPFGPVLDVLPTVSKDGYTVQMTLTPKFTEFLGYEDPKKLNLPVPTDKVTLPLPIIRIRQITTSASVWDGQTIVLGNFSDQMLDTPTGLKGPAKASDKKPSKQILVFITPTIIDSTGNPANKDLGIPSRLIPNF